MPDAFVDPHPVLFTLFILYGFCFLVQMIFYWGIFLRIAIRHEPRATRDEPQEMRHKVSGIRHQATEIIENRKSKIENSSNGVSVVICAHNEFHHLVYTLPQILEQDYPNFEVVVVDHASDDDTAFLLSDLAERYKHLKVVTIKRDLNFFSGKKFPLSIGIKSATKEIILLTDADCHPAGNQWIRLMQEAFTDDREIILGYGPYDKRKGVLNALIRFDTVQVAIQYLSFALAGIPYMGVGRNLAYKKNLFYQQKGFISHYRISSGDDDLFINRVARMRNTGVQTDPGTFTYSEPKHTAGKWITQKRRHLTTASHYRFWHKFLLGFYGIAQLLFWALFVLLLSWKFAWVFVLSVLLLKWGCQYVVVGRGMYRLQEKQLIPWIPLLEWVMILLQAAITCSNFIVKPHKWK
ncbi:MAG: glycosyltransferase [Bacteroidales bacterium]|nr:glycosyltransferase [Bacteroidales bacterium]